MGRPKRIIRMGNSWTYGDAAYLARVLDALLLGNAKEAQEALRHPLAVRAMSRVFEMRSRGAAIVLGLEPSPPLPRRRGLEHLEPGYLPQEKPNAK